MRHRARHRAIPAVRQARSYLVVGPHLCSLSVTSTRSLVGHCCRRGPTMQIPVDGATRSVASSASIATSDYLVQQCGSRVAL